MSRYDPATLEPKWQQAWDEAGTFLAQRTGDKPKYYVLEMFPYPSGRIHIGHVRNYTMGDVIARYKKATGHNVLHPMGFDAFGMPAENAAMENGGHPADWTYQNIDTMVAQMKPLGFGLDWSRMFATCDPEYYGQQQALFLDFLEGRAGLPQERDGELGPGRHDRSGQRTGDRRQGLAFRRGGRTPRTDPVVLQDKRFLGGACWTRWTGSTTGPRRSS
jgi:leucyl-tRNA synthetase